MRRWLDGLLATIALLLAAQVAAATASPAAAAPVVGRPRLERVVDGRGRPVAVVATVDRTAGGVRRTLVLVRGLSRDDLVLATRRTGDGPEPPAHFAWLADHASLRLDHLPDGRLAASDGRRTFRWFPEDAATRTVRCGLSGLVEAVDARLAPAAAEYARMKASLGEALDADVEHPVAALAAIAPPTASPHATDRRAPMPDDDPEAGVLRESAEAAFARLDSIP